MNPYKTIWLNPKQTISVFVANKEKQPLYALPIIIMGLSFGLDMAPKVRPIFEGFVWWSFLIPTLLGIGMAYLFLGLIMPGFVILMGRIWNGTSTMRQMVNVYSLSSIPFSLLLIYQILLFTFGLDPSFEKLNGGLSYIIWLWSFGILIVGVSKIQRFNYGMALLNILLSYLPFLAIGLMIS